MDGQYYINEISHSFADEFLKFHHYLSQTGHGFLGNTQYGLFNKTNDKLVGVCVFGNISVPNTLVGAFGLDRDSDQSHFCELTRLSMDDDLKERNLTSWFVSRCLRMIKTKIKARAIISYADSRFHNGYIYQATNFKYYGLTDKKTDFFELGEDGKEKQIWRGGVKEKNGVWRDRTRKHRYMVVYDKHLNVKWQQQPYPKGENNEMELKVQDIYQQNLFY